MVQVIQVLALAAVQVLGSAVVLPADDAQHILLDTQGTAVKDVYKVKDE